MITSERQILNKPEDKWIKSGGGMAQVQLRNPQKSQQNFLQTRIDDEDVIVKQETDTQSDDTVKLEDLQDAENEYYQNNQHLFTNF